MIVVADSSPLIVLVRIGQVHILQALFREVVIPPEVAVELASPKRPKAVHDFIHARPNWLLIQGVATLLEIEDLHEGERSSISLAVETEADLLLIDERDGRRAALARNLKIAGTIAILERAAESNLLDLEEAFDRIKATDFWISPKLLDAQLKRHRERGGK